MEGSILIKGDEGHSRLPGMCSSRYTSYQDPQAGLQVQGSIFNTRAAIDFLYVYEKAHTSCRKLGE